MRLSHRLVLLVSAWPLGLTSQSAAQQHLVVPAYADVTDGSSMGRVVADQASRLQVVIDAAHLVPLIGKQITAVQWRRDATASEALVGGQVSAVARIGVSSRSAAAATTDFRTNLPTPVEVFRGALSFPTSPALASGASGAAVDWSPPNIVVVPFSTPFAYSGGNLCVEIEQAGLALWWPIDAEEESLSGSQRSSGVSCMTHTLDSLSGRSLGLSDSALVVGQTANFVVRGEAGSTGFLVIGARLLPVPLDLAVVNAAGCFLYVDPIQALSTTLPLDEIYPGQGAFGGVLLTIPPDPTFVGIAIHSQWIEWGATLRSSEALVGTVSTRVPSLGMSSVWDGGAPAVNVLHAPILRFEAR